MNPRQVLQAHEPLRFILPDGRVVEIGVPREGRVTVTNAIGVVTELDADEFVRRENEILQ